MFASVNAVQVPCSQVLEPENVPGAILWLALAEARGSADGISQANVVSQAHQATGSVKTRGHENLCCAFVACSAHVSEHGEVGSGAAGAPQMFSMPGGAQATRSATGGAGRASKNSEACGLSACSVGKALEGHISIHASSASTARHTCTLDT